MFRPKRSDREKILARWAVDEATWRTFVSEVRRYKGQPGAGHCKVGRLDDPPPSGLGVVIREDAVFVGKQSFDLGFYSRSANLREHWLEFAIDLGEDAGYFIPVPVPAHARAEAARFAGLFNAAVAEERHKAAHDRARPILRNKLLNFVEGHFAISMLIFFFVLIPAFVAIVAWLQSWIGAAE